jgi:transposase
MSRSRPECPSEFRQKLIELVEAGRSPEELAKEFEPSAQTIRNWVKRAQADGGKRRDVLTSAEREELTKLRRELKQVKLEREILAKATAWFARGPIRTRRSLPVRSGAPGRVSGENDVSRVRRLPERLLRVGKARAVGARIGGCEADGAHPVLPCALEGCVRGGEHPRGSSR